MRLSAMIALSALSIVPASAQDAERFSMERTDTGFVRMDRVTGQMSICTERDGQLVCKLAADERKAFEGEVDRLAAKLDELERRIAAVESRPPAGLPSESEFEQSLSMMERFFRHFWGIVKEFEREETTKTPDAPAPDRT